MPSFSSNASIAIASNVGPSIVIVTVASSPGPSMSIAAVEPGGSTSGSSTPVSWPLTCCRRAGEEVDVEQDQFERVGVQPVPLDVGGIDADAVGLAEGELERRVGVDIDVQVVGLEPGGR